MKKTLIMGIGNLLLGDEGVGIHAAWALQEKELPDYVEVLDAGTAFLDAIPSIENKDRLIIIDAMEADGVPGTIYRMPLEKCMKKGRIDSLHGFDVFRMIAMTGNKKNADVIVFGVEPSELKWSMELSPQVSKSIPGLLEALYREITIN